MVNRYDFYPGDYIRDTSDLSMAEDGAYIRLMNWYYANERPIDDSRKFSIARAVTPEEQKITQWVLDRFFILAERDEDSVWIHLRVESEIAKAAPRINASKRNGKKGGRPKKITQQKPNGLSTGIPNGVPSRESSPSPSPSSSGKKIYIKKQTSKDQVEETSKVDLQPIDEALEFLPIEQDRLLAKFILTAWPDCTVQDAIAWVQQAKSYLLQLEEEPLNWIQDVATSKSPNDSVYVQGQNKLHQWLMNCLKSTIRKQAEQSKQKLDSFKYGMDN